MIPILFNEIATDFTTYGIGVLRECTSCEVTEERNGSFELTLKYPTSGDLFSYLKNERIIVAKPNDLSKNQAFRIYKVTTPLKGEVTVYAQHISYDLATIGVMPFDIENASPKYAMDQVLLHSSIPNNFSFQSDYLTVKQFKVSKPVSIRSLLGGSEGSILDSWGGEYEWDNFKIKHHTHRGSDNGVVIAYGKNLTKLEHESDITDIYTHILPYGVIKDDNDKETVVTLPECVLPLTSTILKNGKVYIRDFTDDFKEDERITEYELRTKANVWIKNHPLGVENSSIEVSFEPLWNQSEYAAIHERLSLCDTVTVKHSNLGVTAKMKVVKTVYDSLKEKYKSITLGTLKASLTSKINDLENVVTDTKKSVDRLPSLLNSAIDSATKQITGNTGGSVVLHSNSNGTPYELLIMDSEDINSAVNVWRWNLGGLGFSSHGYNGPYETAVTGDGAIVADFITAGSLVANIIKAGTLSSNDGSSYWNLESGEVVLRAYATTASVEEQTNRIDNIEEQKMYRLVISSSNGNIFKNGNISTVLTATVFSWDKDVTDELDDNQFIWTRVSSDSEADKVWNSAHFGGTKSITITNDDVKARATFYCDLIDTSTRESLLG
jgi:phage minor structural protein